MQGGSFDFMTKDSTALLHLVAFGCHRWCGNKKRLRSHLGEAFLGGYAINKCCHMAFGQRFVWVTDCYALNFILSYDGQNPAILHIQMRFMRWDMVIEHRNDVCLTNVDYFSRLGTDLCFDPLLNEYVQQVDAICHCSPALMELPIVPRNQSYFQKTTSEYATQVGRTSISTPTKCISCHYHHWAPASINLASYFWDSHSCKNHM
jgi:hypothetical protein